MTDAPLAQREVTLLEVLDRVLDKGVVIAGDLTISVAGIDLIYLGLRVLLSSVETMESSIATAAENRHSALRTPHSALPTLKGGETCPHSIFTAS